MSEEVVPPCTQCGRKSVTRDGRHWCRSCLMKWVFSQTPIEYPPRYRPPEAKQDMAREPSPWNELNVRLLEDAGND